MSEHGAPRPEVSPPPTAPEVPGYRLGALLGRGAAGAVWSAVRDGDGRRFAVKVLPGAAARAGSAQALRESGVLSRVDTPHLVRLEQAVPLGDGALALVLQLAGGGSLARVVASRGHLSAGETVTTLAPLAEALGDLHATGVVHSDLSAGNVLFTADGMPLLADLGVARLVGERSEQLHGTAGFVAPEVAHGGTPGPAADVYALGALGWLALTGATASTAAVRPPLRDVAPQATPALAAAIAACMASEPEDRPSARQAAVALYDAAPPEPVQLATGTDPGSALTHRLRADAARASTPAAGRVPRGAKTTGLSAARQRASGRGATGGKATGRAATERSEVGRGASFGALARRRLPGASGGRGRSLLASAVAVLAVLLGAAWVLTHGPGRAVPPANPSAAGPSRVAAPGSTAGSHRSSPRPTTAASPVQSQASPRKPAGQRLHATAPAVDLTLSRAAAGAHPTELAALLAGRRTSALVSRDASALGRVDVRGSPAWRADAALIGRLVDLGGTYSGLTSAARSGALVQDAGSEVTVRASVQMSGYTYRQNGTAPQRRPGSVRTVRLHLRWEQGAWRIASVS